MQLRMNQRLLSFCIFLSLFAHGLVIFMLQQHSVWFMAKAQSLSSTPFVKSEILKQSFCNLSQEKQSAPFTLPKINYSEQLKNHSVQKKTPKKEEKIAFQSPQLLHTSAFHSANDTVRKIKPPFDQSLKLDLPSFTLPTSTAKRDIQKSPALPPKIPEHPPVLTNHPSIKIIAPQLPLIAYENAKLEIPHLFASGSIRRPLLTIPASQLPSFPTLEELETSNYSESFDIDLVCTPHPDHGYIFAITLIPHADLNLPKIQQHYCFLIDRANSIQRERLLASKAAVMKAIEDLPLDDTFNIIVFDSKIEKLFSSPQNPNDAALYQARSFLDKISLGSFFAPADLYNPLLLTLPSDIQDDEVYTTILLTDGGNFAKKTAMRAVLQTWTWQNSGSVSLFAICMGNDPQISTLDLACAFNKGRLYFSPTKRGLKRKMTKIMKNIQKPIAKNISYHSITQSNTNQIQLYPRSTQSSQLYLDQPFVIIGSSEKLDDFVLFVQGRLKDRWMNVKKTISFINAKKGGSSLKEEWAIQQAHEYYERYVRDDNPEHLANARALLEPFHIQPAFQ